MWWCHCQLFPFQAKQTGRQEDKQVDTFWSPCQPPDKRGTDCGSGQPVHHPSVGSLHECRPIPSKYPNRPGCSACFTRWFQTTKLLIQSLISLVFHLNIFSAHLAEHSSLNLRDWDWVPHSLSLLYKQPFVRAQFWRGKCSFFINIVIPKTKRKIFPAMY